MEYKNLADMFFSKRETMGQKPAFSFKEKGEWKEFTWEVVVEKAEKLAAGLAQLGIQKGQKVALMSHNRLEWALIDYAAQAIGAVLTPLYPSLLEDQVKYILDDSEAEVVIVSDELLYLKVKNVQSSLKYTKYFYLMDEGDVSLPAAWKSLADLAKTGKDYLEQHPNFIVESIAKISQNDVATLIYTSGTTGEPKGAILTHHNFLSNVESASSIIPVSKDDSFLSFLPLSHIFERMAGHYLSCYHGATVYYAESIDTVADNLKEVKPTLMISVPRLYEKIYAKVLDGVEAGSPIKQKIFHWAIGVGKVYIKKIMMKEMVGKALQIKYNLAHKLVFSKLHAAIGGRNRFMVSGGAPLSPEIAEFFGAVGIRILEGYGLTETSPVIAVNQLDAFRFGTVGPIIPGVEVKIAEDGEILSRGDHIMVGYFKKEAETKEAIDEEGWFHTGDIGVFEDGFLRITDRKKNIIVTSGGKNIAPQPIENALVTTKYIEQAMMVGDKRKFCTAVIVAAEDPLKEWAKSQGKSFNTYEELVKLDGVKKLILAEIKKATPRLASYETIKNIVLATSPFSIESGELTPSLKIKRPVVEGKYAAEIEEMYDV
jgi:long-chain acyl-CoA synthetase